MAHLALTATSGTVTVPAGMYSAIVRCIGPGGNGFNAASAAGGAYAESTIAVNPGDVLSYQVGAGGSGNDTWFVSSATAMAKAGPNATAFNAGGTAPAATSSVGAIRFKGGNGRSNGTSYGGLGGGGAAGPNGAGADGGAAAALYNAGTGGGAANGGSVGGSHSSNTQAGAGGNSRGGTGSGAGGSGSGAAGGNGTSGTGAGGGGAGGNSSDPTIDAQGGNGAQEDLWQVGATWYGPGGGGGGGAGVTTSKAGNGGGYGAGGAACGRNQVPNASAGLGSQGVIVIDWSTAGLQLPTSYATMIGA